MNFEKRVLVISHNSFSNVLNNGKTLESMFRCFKKENLAQMFFSTNEIPDFEFCNNYFKITDSNVLKGLIKGYADCGTKLNNIAKVEDELNSEGLLSRKIFNVAKSKAQDLVLFRDFLWKFNSWKSKSMLSWVKDFNPDVIFYVGANSGFSHDVANFLSSYYNKPLVVFFTDDYLIYPKYKHMFQKIQQMRMRKFYRRTVNNSSLCFVIGDLMAKEYTKYFKKEFRPIMNSVMLQEYSEYKNSNESLNLSYFGGLHLHRWKMLVRLAKILPFGFINVYSMGDLTSEVETAFKESNIVFKGGVKGDDLRQAIINTDVLLHVESNDSFYRSITKLSISTKIPEYLMSGRLVLGFGPPDVASMRILSDNEIGWVISSDDTDNIISKKLDKLYDYEFRKERGKKGYDFALENFDNKYISENFKKIIENL